MGAGGGSGPSHRKAGPEGQQQGQRECRFGTNMPLMSSAFDTAMWLNAA